MDKNKRENLSTMETYFFINPFRLSNKPNQSLSKTTFFFSFKLKKTQFIRPFLSPSNNSRSDSVLRRHSQPDRVICNHQGLNYINYYRKYCLPILQSSNYYLIFFKVWNPVVRCRVAFEAPRHHLSVLPPL